MEPTSREMESEPVTLTKDEYARLWAAVAKMHLKPSIDEAPAKKAEGGVDQRQKEISNASASAKALPAKRKKN